MAPVLPIGKFDGSLQKIALCMFSLGFTNL